MKYPENRQEDEQMTIYRVVIQADVAVSMGKDTVMEEIAEMFESNTSPTHWDLFDVEINERDGERVSP